MLRLTLSISSGRGRINKIDHHLNIRGREQGKGMTGNVHHRSSLDSLTLSLHRTQFWHNEWPLIFDNFLFLIVNFVEKRCACSASLGATGTSLLFGDTLRNETLDNVCVFSFNREACVNVSFQEITHLASPPKTMQSRPSDILFLVFFFVFVFVFRYFTWISILFYAVAGG